MDDEQTTTHEPSPREVALTLAIEHAQGRLTAAAEVVDAARVFERYLAGD